MATVGHPEPGHLTFEPVPEDPGHRRGRGQGLEGMTLTALPGSHRVHLHDRAHVVGLEKPEHLVGTRGKLSHGLVRIETRDQLSCIHSLNPSLLLDRPDCSDRQLASAAGQASEIIPVPVELRYPDGKVVAHPDGVTAGEVAASIGPGLARAAVAAKVNGELIDLGRPIQEDGDFSVITIDTPEGLHVLRHSSAHVLAQAVLDLFEGATFAIGPADRGRLLLRLQSRDAVHARGSRSHRDPNAGDRRRRPAVPAARR